MSQAQTGEIVRLHAIVSGRVQGVAYRHYTRLQARELGVTGWVQNLPDGDVLLLAEGPREALEALLAWCHRGPPMAKVIQVQSRWEKATGEFNQFLIAH